MRLFTKPMDNNSEPLQTSTEGLSQIGNFDKRYETDDSEQLSSSEFSPIATRRALCFSPIPHSSPVPIFSNRKAKVHIGSAAEKILNHLGETDADAITLWDNVQVIRGEIAHSILDANNHYTADWINLLMFYCLASDDFQRFPAIPVHLINQITTELLTSDVQRAFIPLNVAFDDQNPENINHWVALIIDKEHGIIFYLDPAQQTEPPDTIHQLNAFLGHNQPVQKNPIDLQHSEKEDEWLRHCGAYVIEIFLVFQTHYSRKQTIVEPESNSTDSITLASALSVIPCGDAERAQDIRDQHISTVQSTLGINNQSATVSRFLF